MKRYGQFCPMARAAEILAERWTLLIVRELLAGEDRFNAIARGIPRLSPSLLATRLRELQRCGLVTRQVRNGEPRYHLTQAGAELDPVVTQMAAWGARWIQDLRADELDPILILLDVKRRSDPSRMPDRRRTVEIVFGDLAPTQQRWWLVLSRGDGADVCDVDPGRPVDVRLDTETTTFTRVWMGHVSWASALREETIRLTGDRAALAALPGWLGTSPLADVDRADSPIRGNSRPSD